MFETLASPTDKNPNPDTPETKVAQVISQVMTIQQAGKQ
jgi:hypothetical protein